MTLVVIHLQLLLQVTHSGQSNAIVVSPINFIDSISTSKSINIFFNYNWLLDGPIESHLYLPLRPAIYIISLLRILFNTKRNCLACQVEDTNIKKHLFIRSTTAPHGCYRFHRLTRGLKFDSLGVKFGFHPIEDIIAQHKGNTRYQEVTTNELVITSCKPPFQDAFQNGWPLRGQLLSGPNDPKSLDD